LMNEVSALYSAYQPAESDHRSDPLPPLPIQYADYAQWQRSWLSGERRRRQIDYWRCTLAGIPALLPLPTDRTRPARQDYAGAYHEVKFDADFSARLKVFSRSHGVTLYMTLIASWAALLAHLSGQEDIVIGSPIAGRTRSETESLIGFFINILVLRFRAQPDQPVTQWLEHIKQQVLGAQQHQDLPLGEILDIVQPPHNIAHAPIFQVMFAWQNVPPGKLELRGLEVLPFEAQAGDTSKFDLSLSLQEVDGRIVGAMEYAAALFDASTIARHVEHWRRLLEAMLTDDRQALNHLPLPTADQRTREANAIVSEEEQIAHGELNTRIHPLANLTRLTHLTPFRKEGRCAPLFIVHHASGTCAYARDLIPWIDADIPIYGFSAAGFGTGEVPLDSVAEMAALYVSDIQAVQPQGPYNIAGYSAGGTIAYEIARQLLAAGQSVGFLGLIDTHGEYGQLSPVVEMDAAPDMPIGLDAETLGRYRSVRTGIEQALLGYEIQRLPIAVELFAAADSLNTDPTLGWGELLNTQMRIQVIECDHDTIIKSPHVMRVGAAISRSLAGGPMLR
jgi:thioesterase domain-containing protein